jgi:hypothetical protein
LIDIPTYIPAILKDPDHFISTGGAAVGKQVNIEKACLGADKCRVTTGRQVYTRQAISLPKYGFFVVFFTISP